MKKQIRRAMMCTIAMMVAAIVSLTGVTYAWFSQSDSASVDGMSLGIESKDGGVLMSANPNPGGSGWAYSVNLNFTGTNFKPASTAPSNLTNGSLVFYNGVVNDAKLYMIKTSKLPENAGNSVGEVIEGGSYIKKDLYFNNVDDAEIKVQLGASINGVTTGGKNGLKSADQAMRVAIVSHGAYTIDAENGTNTADVTLASDKSAVMIYEPNAMSHHRGGEDYRYTYGIIAASNETEINVNTDSGDPSYSDSEVNKIESGTGGTSQYIEKIVSYYAQNGERTAPTIQIPANSYYKVTIYIWLEGQDCDCTNEISGSDMDVSLTFKKLPATAN